MQKVLKLNPLADGSTPEILVDNEDSGFVQIQGNWKTEKQGGYGPSFFLDDSRTLNDSKAGSAKSIRFTPEIIKKDVYQIYAYFPKLQHASKKTYITVYDSQKTFEKSINSSDLQIEGQTSGEWVSLASYNLLPGRKAYVEISNKNADGVIAADAVLFVPVR